MATFCRGEIPLIDVLSRSLGNMSIQLHQIQTTALHCVLVLLCCGLSSSKSRGFCYVVTECQSVVTFPT